MKTDNVMKNQRKWYNVGYEYWYNKVWVGGGGGGAMVDWIPSNLMREYDAFHISFKGD